MPGKHPVTAKEMVRTAGSCKSRNREFLYVNTYAVLDIITQHSVIQRVALPRVVPAGLSLTNSFVLRINLGLLIALIISTIYINLR